MTDIDQQVQQLVDFAVDALDQFKAFDVTVLDVKNKTSITDYIVIGSGTSDRQTKAAASFIVEEAKKRQYPVLGTEGEQQGDWILIDLGDVVVHIMLPATRVFYQLEKLWSVDEHLSKDGEALIKKTSSS